jgi:hypothetical protein
MIDKKETHESYGMIGCSRINSQPAKSLFGSSIRHSNSIMLRIGTAEKHRHLNRDWYHKRSNLIEVEMSPTQFAEMITSLNIGDGIPCTIRYLPDNNRIADPPEVRQREVFEDEFKEEIKAIMDNTQEGIKTIKEILNKKGTINKKEKEKMMSAVFEITRIMEDHIPFTQKQFNKAMDKTVMEAKGEVEAFVMNKITSLGLEAMKEQVVEIPEYNITDIVPDNTPDVTMQKEG